MFLGCANDRPDPNRLSKAMKAKVDAAAGLNREAQLLQAASKNLAERLKKMNNEDQATVATLIVMMEATMSLDGNSLSLQKETAARIVENIRPASAVVARVWDPRSIIGGCFDESVAYASAMAKCEKNGKKESECDEAM